MHPQIVLDKIAILPEDPGCYLMRNSAGVIIYVGKAKVLKNRVKSYFTGAHILKVQMMVQEIADFEIIITKNEAEALILENQLIKAHQPRYNILLKDDKSYPFIALTDEKHPRIIMTREPKKKYRFLAGPYTNSRDARNLIEILNYLYQFRKCVKMPKKVCLYYHINQCRGYCEFDFPDDVYDQDIKEVTNFLRGKQALIKGKLETRMFAASEKMEFEQAGIYKKMLDTIDGLQERQGTFANIVHDTDVIAYAVSDEMIAIQIFHVREGSIVARESDVFVYETDAPLELIESYIYQFYQSKHVAQPKDIYLTEDILTESLKASYPEINFFTPQRGKKREVVTFAQDNAVKALEQKSLLALNKYNTTLGATVELGKLLGISTPHTIEIIDTANLGNQDIVSAAVVFTNGVPDKKAYRKYKIKSTKVQDDYQSLREVVYRRLYRMTMEQTPFPDLLIVDGGLGHLHVAQEVVDTFNAPIHVIGLSKNAQHRTDAIVLRDGTKHPLKTTENMYKLLGKMQEEVHRFVIDYHRQKRLQTSFSSVLTEIPGIGEVRRAELLKHFDTIDNIKRASMEELERVVPKRTAQSIRNFFAMQEESEE